MTFQVIDAIGAQNPGSVDTTQQFAPGTIVKAFDSVQGQGEFIYLKGVVGTVAGSVVIYDTQANTTVLAVAGSRGPVAVATGATVANTFGFYQISGSTVVKETGAVAAGKPYATATAGVPSVSVVAGDKIDGVVFKSADGTPSAGFAYAQLSRPTMNGLG